MWHAGLIASWHFDEAQRALAADTVSGGAPLELHGATIEPRRFGRALVLNRRYDYARGPAPGVLRTGTVSFRFRLDAAPQATELLSIQGTLSIIVDAGAGTGLLAQMGERILTSGQQIAPGHWRHLALAFSPDGATLYLDGQAVARDPQANRGLTMGLCRDEYLFVGSLGEQFTPFALDELAIFERCLDEGQALRLALDDYEPAAYSGPPLHPQSVMARDYLDLADPTCGFQRAIDATGAAGGVVALPPGRFVLKRPLVLHSRVTLTGERGQTILAAPAPKASALAAHARSGGLSVLAEDPSMFAVGEAVTLRSDTKANWQGTQALIEAIDASGELELSRPLSDDYMTFDGAVAVTWFPLISATRRHDVHIIDLVIEGVPQGPALNRDAQDPVTRSCPAILLLDCVDATVERCRVDGWPHDGIGVHGGRRLGVTGCAVTNCLGHGLCVEEQARLTQWLGNRAECNLMDGLYVGAAVRDSVVAHGIFQDNAGHGIGGLDQGNDETNLISGNNCLGNQLGAIQQTGESAALVGNLCNGPARATSATRRQF